MELEGVHRYISRGQRWGNEEGGKEEMERVGRTEYDRRKKERA